MPESFFSYIHPLLNLGLSTPSLRHHPATEQVFMTVPMLIDARLRTFIPSLRWILMTGSCLPVHTQELCSAVLTIALDSIFT